MKTEEREFANGTKHTQLVCPRCGRKGNFVTSIADEDYKMPFGKYRGERLYELARTNASYLQWVLKNLDVQKSLRDRIGRALQQPKLA